MKGRGDDPHVADSPGLGDLTKIPQKGKGVLRHKHVPSGCHTLLVHMTQQGTCTNTPGSVREAQLRVTGTMRGPHSSVAPVSLSLTSGWAVGRGRGGEAGEAKTNGEGGVQLSPPPMVMGGSPWGWAHTWPRSWRS